MISYIIGYDYMGKDFKFNFAGGSYKTLSGGIISMIQTLGFLILFWFFGKDLYNKKEPSVVVSNSMKNYYPEVSVKNTNFKFAFRYQDNNGRLINDPLLFSLNSVSYYLEKMESIKM